MNLGTQLHSGVEGMVPQLKPLNRYFRVLVEDADPGIATLIGLSYLPTPSLTISSAEIRVPRLIHLQEPPLAFISHYPTVSWNRTHSVGHSAALCNLVS